jgi:polyhydroxybutyrate depolymerase
MTRHATIGLFAVSCALLQGTPSAFAVETEQIPTDRGTVPLYLPTDLDPGADIPLVISLHGYTGNGTQHENYFNLRSRIDEDRFMLCVPNGTTDAQGNRFWNATDFCCDFENRNPDDSGYLRSLIETIIAAHPVDIGSIHVVGHSNGGFMAYRMACDHADLIASVASLAGATFSRDSRCTPSDPVHVLQIHGTDDDVIRYAGQCIIPFIFCYPGAVESVEKWAGYNHCSNVATEESPLDLDASIPGAETARVILEDGCDEHGSAELWRIEGGSHGPAFNSNFPRELVGWLLEHDRSPDESPCSADVNDDGIVNGGDLSLMLATWGTASEACDVDQDGIVGGGDLSLVLATWGVCP